MNEHRAWGRVLATIGLAAVVPAACHTAGAPEAPAPLDAAAVPATFDLSRVPNRPELVAGNYGRRPTGARDSITPPIGGVASALDHAYQTATESPIPVDTNDARVYYAAGLAAINLDPAAASAAFYWASRIDPSWAQPYFARWYALRAAGRRRMAVRAGAPLPAPLPPAVKTRIDSLVVLAYSRDPFFDEGLTMGDLSATVRARVAIVNGARHRAIDQINSARLQEGEPPFYDNSGGVQVPHEWYMSYGARQFDSAARQLAPVIKKNPDAIALYVYRAKALFYLGQYDSAAAVMQAAIGRMEKLESAKTLPVYFSKEGFTYAIGMAYQQQHRDSASRAAYQRTVTENLGFYMAHLHLANAALVASDTATALTEARLAAEIRPDDPVVQLFLGYALLNAGQPAEAAAHLATAVRADSAFALPYMYLGQAAIAQHDTAGAIAALRGYVVRSRQDESERRDVAVATINALRGTISAVPTP